MYILATLLLFASILLYFKIADRFNIIDKPNERSSHTRITIRGGGIVFAVAVLWAFLMGLASWEVTLAVLMVASVSFVDDIRPLSQLPRFAVHVLASLLVLHESGVWPLALWWIPLALFVFLGWVNIFNFMDGINGITALYALAVLSGFYFIPELIEFRGLMEMVALSVLVFGFFNIRVKAKTFAGDVGSISMALILGYLMVHLLVRTEQIFYLLLFAVYGLDGVLTILHRLLKRENIFQPHRTHLYQYLANEMGWGHLPVSFLYFSVQLLINFVVLYQMQYSASSMLFPLIAFTIGLIFTYIGSKFLVYKKLQTL
ncbi:MAG: glycosyltransferase family 4 protein [Lunatimonas sp.]|uniref:MraY family glycosyltransferase n=1 Tax=Lunatimonas sp. TaxID=2060141 RepID=UPI00263A95A0|nr:glycosyltransferase family 4 protein [Lunatimonas sp.]MCC5936781.1 glycosyltransferase family 4 protein [Lunatimonas sp.]